jgi:hypothetical protein
VRLEEKPVRSRKRKGLDQKLSVSRKYAPANDAGRGLAKPQVGIKKREAARESGLFRSIG